MPAMLRGIVVPADADKPIYVEEFEKGNRAQYEWTVAGRFRYVQLANPDCALYVNESSPTQTKPRNERATLILHVHKPSSYPSDSVTGDAFILGPSNTDAPDELIQVLTGRVSLRIEAQFNPDGPWERMTEVFDEWQSAYTVAVEVVHAWEKIHAMRVVPA